MASNTAPRKAQSKANKPASGKKDAGIAVPVKRRTDWEAVERDYRIDKFTLRELAKKHDANHATIARRAEREGWTKDLTGAIRQATNARVISETVQQKCDTAQQNATDTVLAAAEINTRVILGHRTGLKALTDVKRTLLNQIEQAAANMTDLAEIIEMVRKPDDNGIDRANDALKKAMSRSALVDDLKKLADVDEKVRKGEREAFGLDDDGKPDRNGLEEAATAELQALRARLLNER